MKIKLDFYFIHLLWWTPGVDNGDIFDVEDFDITPYDDINTLHYKQAIATQRMIIRNLDALCKQEISTKPQQGQPSYYPKRTAEDDWINGEEDDWLYIYNLVRAVTHPYPGALAKIEGRTYKIWKVRPFDSRLSYPDRHYGEVVEVFDDAKVINCRGGLLLLESYEYID